MMNSLSIAFRRKKLKYWLVYLAKVLLGLVIVSPLLYAVSVSLMPRSDVMATPPKLIPDVITFSNYERVLRLFPFTTYLKNTLIVCTVEIISQVVICSFAAYAFAFFDFKGKRFLFAFILATMMIPGETTVVSNYLTIQNLRLVDTYIALLFPTLVSGMGIFMMRQFYLSVPIELKQAATIDGCGDMSFFFRVLMPISLPNLTSLGIYVFVNAYNRFFWPLLVTNSDHMRTIQIGASYLRDAESYNYGVVMAGTVLCLIPSIIVFIVGLKYLVRGLTAGAIKG